MKAILNTAMAGLAGIPPPHAGLTESWSLLLALARSTASAASGSERHDQSLTAWL